MECEVVMQQQIIEQIKDSCSVSSTAVQSENEEAWLAARTRGIGGSDVGSICGVNPWSSALQVYFNKTGQFQDERTPNDAAQERMHWGHVLEPVVAAEFEARNEGLFCVEANCSFKSNTHSFLLANVDRFVVDKTGKIVGILECKTAGAQMATEWENGDIPLSYFYQVQHYMYITGIHRAWICCLVGGNKFYQYDIYFDEALYLNVILPTLESFWNNNVLKLVEPEVQTADNELFNSLFPAEEVDATPVSFDVSFDDIGKEYLEAKAQEKVLKKRIEELQASIKQHLQINAKGYSPSYEFVWQPRTRTSVDSAMLKAMYPDVYEAVTKVTSYRQMSVKAVSNEDLSF